MGYKHSYDIIQTYQQIRAAGAECANPRTDGFIAWGVKQDLYQLKWYLDDLLKSCPEFSSIETDWLREQEQKKIIKILKDDIQ
jgi:hypothetical protein